MEALKDIVIAGTGGFALEVEWLLERLNKKLECWNFLGFVQNDVDVGTGYGNAKVVCDDETLAMRWDRPVGVVIAIANPKIRRKLAAYYRQNPRVYFPALIDPGIAEPTNTDIGEGCILCAGTVITTRCTLGRFTIVNMDCTIGHESKLGEYCTLYPSVNVSGCTDIGDSVELYTGAFVAPHLQIGDRCVVGACAPVFNNMKADSVALCAPARVMKRPSE